ncbi:MAG TPA: hypothetical protein PKC69_11550 [Chitinophagaceae bacterium]|nr:hypothetical protein [Chitinophagaceae bacterium]
MKKMFLILTAAAMAVAFSAFIKVKEQDGFLYKDAGDEWQEVPSHINVPALCPPANVRQCQILIDDQLRDIYNADESPYMRN